jgi:hypothetical protein
MYRKRHTQQNHGNNKGENQAGQLRGSHLGSLSLEVKDLERIERLIHLLDV